MLGGLCRDAMAGCVKDFVFLLIRVSALLSVTLEIFFAVFNVTIPPLPLRALTNCCGLGLSTSLLNENADLSNGLGGIFSWLPART